jgi:hypothetical protein
VSTACENGSVSFLVRVGRGGAREGKPEAMAAEEDETEGEVDEEAGRVGGGSLQRDKESEACRGKIGEEKTHRPALSAPSSSSSHAGFHPPRGDDAPSCALKCPSVVVARRRGLGKVL